MERGDHKEIQRQSSFQDTSGGETPGIPAELRGAPKEVASRFFRLASGRVLIAPFVKEKFGW